MKKVLITNDDGFDSNGIITLFEILKSFKEIHPIIVAPAFDKSSFSHSLSINKPLHIIKVKEDIYKVEDGTPSDCIYMALDKILKPDLIISGINHGANLGEDISYSGTAAAAMEGILHGVSSIAFSQYYKNEINFKNSKEVIKIIIKKILKEYPKLNFREFLNINIPCDELQGIKICPMGKRKYLAKTNKANNPRSNNYFWIGKQNLDSCDEKENDINLVKKGYATITPIKMDWTAYESFENLRKWLDG